MKRVIKEVLVVLVICVGIMSIVDGIIQPGYFIKSAIKLPVFTILPLIVLKKNGLKYIDFFKIDKSLLKRLITFSITEYLFLVLGFLIVRNFFDFSKITGALSQGQGVNGKNFIFVSLYISFINSLLEEFFFRGFSFLFLKKHLAKKWAYLISAFSFAIYHVFFMIGWYDWFMFLLIVLGLVVAGLMFDFIDDYTDSILSSWFVHMFANFGINTIGFILFLGL